MSVSPPDTAEWRLILAAEQHDPDVVKKKELPQLPGVYLWRHLGESTYVGKAEVLQDRLSTHRGRGLSLAKSSLRRNVAHHLFGLVPAATGTGRQKVTREQADAIAVWIRSMTVAWVKCESVPAAVALETTLRRQWLPPLNVV